MNMVKRLYSRKKASCRHFGSPVRCIALLLISVIIISTTSVTAVTSVEERAQEQEFRRSPESSWIYDLQVEEKRDLQQCQSLSDILCETSIFESFCILLTEYELFDELSGDFSSPNWTVFVPTNAALEEILDTIDQNTSSFLAASNNDTDTAFLGDEWINNDPLKDLLGFHIVRDRMISGTDLVCNDTLVMSNGKKTKVFCDGDNGLYLTGSGNTKQPRVVVTDVIACNGIIHVIDGVLIDRNDEDDSDNSDDNSDGEDGESAIFSTTNTTNTVLGRIEPNQKSHQHDAESPIPDCQSIRNMFSRNCLRIGRFERTSLRRSSFGGSR